MARTTLALSTFVANSSLAGPAGTAGNTDGHLITNCPTEEVVLRCVVATATTNVTVLAGDAPPALSAGQGNLVVACPVGTTFIGPFTSARFAQNNGELHIDYATAANVTITAFHLPRTA